MHRLQTTSTFGREISSQPKQRPHTVPQQPVLSGCRESRPPSVRWGSTWGEACGMRGTLPPARPARVTTRPAARGRTISRQKCVLVPTLFHVESSVGKCGSLLHCTRVYKSTQSYLGFPPRSLIGGPWRKDESWPLFADVFEKWLLRPKDLLGVNFVKHFNLPYLFETREPRRVCGVVTFRDCELSHCLPIASPLSSSQPAPPSPHTWTVPGRPYMYMRCDGGAPVLPYRTPSAPEPQSRSPPGGR